MGGRGSGRPVSFGLTADKTGDFHSIDIAWLRKQGSFKPGYTGNITWSRGGTKTGWVGYRIERAGMRLIYRTRSTGGDWHDVEEVIPFINTPTNFSGRRIWFVCPSCLRRCRILYGGAYFRCRGCHNLKYESQYESGFSGAASLRHKLRKQLGHCGSLEDPFPEKPKGMHWKTYERLRAKDEGLELRWCEGIAGWLARVRS